MSIGISLGMALGRTTKVGYAVTPTNNLVEGIGDSITVASHNTAGAGIDTTTLFQPRIQNTSGSVGGYLTWAMILPKTGASYGDGRFRFVGTHATTGMDTATVLSTHINGADSPLNSSPKPGIVFVLVGANDCGEGKIQTGGVVNQSTLDAWVVNVRAICQALINAGILPCLCTVTPHTTANLRVAIAAMNVQIPLIAASMNIPWADTASAVSSGGQWIANYNVDANHPSVTGAKAMGQVARDAVELILPQTSPSLVTTATDGTGLNNFYENGANQVVGGTAGVPKGGSPAASAYYSWTANGATPTLAARGGYDGNAWIWDKTSDASGDTTASGSSVGNGVMTLVDGHTYEWGFVADMESWAQDDMFFQVSLQKVTDSSKRCDLVLRRDANFSSAIAPFKYFKTIKCNATTFPAGTYRVSITMGDGATTTNATGKGAVGQITVRSLGAV